MAGFLSRRRYEVLALGLGSVLAALHFQVENSQSNGLRVGGGADSPWQVFVRGMQQLEGRASDVQFRARGSRPPSPQVVVVEIDERSAQRYGLWPWPRDVIAKGLDGLFAAGVAAVGLDISFIDQTGDSGAQARELLQAFDEAVGPQPDPKLQAFRAGLAKDATSSPDDALEAALRRGGKRLVQGVFPYPDTDLPNFSPEKQKEHLEVIEPFLIRDVVLKGGVRKQLPVMSLDMWPSYAAQTPLRRFADTGTLQGHLSPVLDVDGAIRRAALLARLDGPKGLLPSMSLQTAAVALGATIEPVNGLGILTSIRLVREGAPTVEVPVQSIDGLTMINYVGPGTDFARVSMIDVIDGTVDRAKLEGKAVLVGVTLTGSAGDQRVTPFRELEPGIYTHASMLSNLLDGKFLRRSDWLTFVEVLAMLLSSALLAVLVPRLKSFGLKLVVMLGLTVTWLLVDQTVFAQGIELATVMPLANILLTSFGLIFLGYLSVDREKLQMRSTFSKYLGEEVMEEAIKNPEKLNRGEKREMTVLFSDIRGFTTLSERMQPEKLADFIKEYLSPMTGIVFEEKGTLDKYIGDAVMAFWNAPLDQQDHALRACRAAWKMLLKLEELKAKWRAANYPEFDIGVGINTGPMIVGNMGSDVRVDYTVMGDAVNLGSRLEGTNKEYETRIIFSESTFAQVQGQVISRRLGAVRVKGKRKPVKIFELRGIGTPTGKEAEAIAAFEGALDAYTEQQWDTAKQKFEAALALWGEDGPCRRYLEEIEHFRVEPPGPGWDGVYTATSK